MPAPMFEAQSLTELIALRAGQLSQLDSRGATITNK